MFELGFVSLNTGMEMRETRCEVQSQGEEAGALEGFRCKQVLCGALGASGVAVSGRWNGGAVERQTLEFPRPWTRRWWVEAGGLTTSAPFPEDVGEREAQRRHVLGSYSHHLCKD